jgi:DNA end-binding protein Ku
MATPSSRVLWKGAISFGLVHIPVALHSATIENELDFDWLDKRTMDPVGYKRINKRTGKEIDKENIVKGIAYEDHQYVVLTDDEIRAAHPESTQTIDIEMFVSATDIPFIYLERPYYLAPLGKGAKVYALLREALLKTERVGIARVVIQTKQHLAALIPSGPGLILNLLRWGDEIRSWENLDLPAEGAKASGLNDRELKMATQLVDELSSTWKPDDFHDTFKDEIMKLVEHKIKTRDTETVEEVKPEAPRRTADIVDLTELLQRSLKKGGGAKASAKGGDAADEDTPPRKTTRTARKTPARTPARKRA